MGDAGGDQTKGWRTGRDRPTFRLLAGRAWASLDQSQVGLQSVCNVVVVVAAAAAATSAPIFGKFL